MNARRERLAAAALVGLLAKEGHSDPEMLAADALEIADAVIGLADADEEEPDPDERIPYNLTELGRVTSRASELEQLIRELLASESARRCLKRHTPGTLGQLETLLSTTSAVAAPTAAPTQHREEQSR